MSKGWTQSRKAKQRKAIYRWRPWEKSTGPKSDAGKARVSSNALKHGLRSKAFEAECRRVRHALEALGA